jgi:hypothetical protein
VQQLVVVVLALCTFDGTLWWKLALPSPVPFQTTEADVHEDVLGLPQSFIEGKTPELFAVREVVLAAALVAVLVVA